MKTKQSETKQIIGLYKANKHTGKQIGEIVGVSERTVQRRIKEFNDGKHEYCRDLVIDVTEWEKEENLEILEMIKSNSYAKVVNMGLKSLTQERINEELDNRGLRGVTGLIGTLIDKRIKSYAIDLEKENLALKNKIASNSRQVVFIDEGELYASSNELQKADPKDIS